VVSNLTVSHGIVADGVENYRSFVGYNGMVFIRTLVNQIYVQTHQHMHTFNKKSARVGAFVYKFSDYVLSMENIKFNELFAFGRELQGETCPNLIP
jgi:hypothetical protein